MPTYPNLDQHLGLHQQLEIIYVVDGFEATLRNEEGYQPLEFTGSGETIDGALAALEVGLAQLPNGFSMKRGSA